MISFRSTVWFVYAFSFLCPYALHSQSLDPKQAQLEALQKKLDSVLSQVGEIQTQIKELENATPIAVPRGSTTAPQKPATPTTEPELISEHEDISNETATRQTYLDDPPDAPRFDNEPLDPRYPGFFRLPGTRTFLRIGGFVRSDFVYDLRPAGFVDAFIPASIPIPTPANVYNSTISVRPTRLSLDFLTPTENFGTVRSLLEVDLFGANTTPRLRHASITTVL